MGALIGVPAEHAEQIWHHVLPFIERYLSKSKEHRWEAGDILESIIQRDRQLWVIPTDSGLETVVLTEILNFPRVRECNVFMVSGKMTARPDWLAIRQDLVDWAAEKGCHYISTMARKGSEKVMGWESRQTYIVRSI